MENPDIRAKILEDIYNRKQQGLEILTRPDKYAEFLGIPRDLANFNMQYLIEAGLVKGRLTSSMGTTKKDAFLFDLTNLGMDAVEGKNGQEFSINYKIININAPVNQPQISIGNNVQQKQTININTFEEFDRYLDSNFRSDEVSELKKQIIELQRQIKEGNIKTSTFEKIKDYAGKLGPIVVEILSKIFFKEIGS